MIKYNLRLRIARTEVEVSFLDDSESQKTKELYRNQRIAVVLHKSKDRLDFINEMQAKFSELGVDNPKTEEHFIKRKKGFFYPEIEIKLCNYEFHEKLTIDQTGKVQVLDRRTEKEWEKLHNLVAKVYSNLFKILYIIKKDVDAFYIADFSRYVGLINMGPMQNLEYSKIQISENGSWSKPLSFDSGSFASSGKKVKIKLSAEELKQLNSYDLVKPQWQFYWDYLFLAESHLRNGDLRVACIELDIALDLIIRDYIKHKLELDSDVFDGLSKDKSTGDFLKITSFIVSEQYRSMIGDFQKLHNLRNTILHRYQRKIVRNDIELIERCRTNLLKIISWLESRN